MFCFAGHLLPAQFTSNHFCAVQLDEACLQEPEGIFVFRFFNKALQKNPDKRYVSGAEVVVALKRETWGVS